jgi:hypothetical protein
MNKLSLFVAMLITWLGVTALLAVIFALLFRDTPLGFGITMGCYVIGTGMLMSMLYIILSHNDRNVIP